MGVSGVAVVMLELPFTVILYLPDFDTFHETS
jgi:hypothetical protein